MTKRHGDSPCFITGTDQLLGNVLYFRHNGRQKANLQNRRPSEFTIGLDTESMVFRSAPSEETLSLQPIDSHFRRRKSTGYCRKNETHPSTCPAFLHFNGGNEKHQGAFYSALLKSWDFTCHLGKLNLVDVDRRICQRDVSLPKRSAECAFMDNCR